MKNLTKTIEAYASMYEERHIGFGYSDAKSKHASNGISTMHKAGLKINHDDMTTPTGNTPGSKAHSKPDATVHYERGDEAHRDGASGITLHTDAAKKHAGVQHLNKAKG